MAQFESQAEAFLRGIQDPADRQRVKEEFTLQRKVPTVPAVEVSPVLQPIQTEQPGASVIANKPTPSFVWVLYAGVAVLALALVSGGRR